MSTDFTEIIVDKSGKVRDLARTLPAIQQQPEELTPEVSTNGYIEGTLKYPQTDSFCNMSSTDQKKLYFKLLTETLSVIDPLNRGANQFVYEYFKTGHVHCHFYVKLKEQRFFIEGLLADIAKKWHRMMPVKKFQRYHLYNGKNLNSEWHRYCCPSITLQYRYENEMYEGDNEAFHRQPRLNYWIYYMNKAQLI